jgi:trk system potassium uptake protein TrkH
VVSMTRSRILRIVAPLDRRAVVAYSAVLLRLFALALIPTIAVALIDGRPAMAARLGLAATIGGVVGWKGARRRPPDIALREALVVTALAYPIWSLLASLAYLPGSGLLSAWFETLSGITTTGLSVLEAPDLTYADRFVRAYLQWLGGAGIVVAGLVILARLGGAALHLYASERGRDTLVGSVTTTTRLVLRVYLALTVVIWLAYTAAGAAPHEAVLAVLTTVSTGGFAPWEGGMAVAPTAVVGVGVVGMLAGATTFTSFRSPKRLAGDRQFRALLIAAASAGLIALVAEDRIAFGPVFDAVSSITTTGYDTSAPAGWAPARQLLAILLMMVGGTAGSTAGGIKLWRVLAGLRLIHRWIVRRLAPREAVLPPADSDQGKLELGDLAAFLVAYSAMLVAGALVLALAGLPSADALFGSASALGTVGLWSGAPIPMLPGYAQVCLMLLMWAGRLEILAVLIVLLPASWRHERRH